MQRFIYSMLIVAFIIIVMCISVTIYMINTSNTFFNEMTMLSDYYASVEEMNLSALNYITTENESVLENYFEKKEQAVSTISEIANRLNRQNKGAQAHRMTFLNNMVVTYDETFQEFIQSKTDWYVYYLELDYNNMLIQQTALNYNNIIVDVMKQDMDNVKSLWVNQFVATGILLIFLLIIAIMLSRFYTNKIILPLADIKNNITKIKEGDYSIKSVDNTATEISILIHSFGEMADSIKNNVELLKENARLDKLLLEQENENLVMKNLLYKSELQSLQAQINPHFLFNTLNMVSQNSLLKGDEESGMMIAEISSLLRYGMEKSNKISTLNEELGFIQSYCNIQQKRFDGRVEFIIEIEPSLPAISMPGMVLQPIIENSIMHGVNDLVNDAEIVIRVFKRDEFLHVHIEDNGKGIDSEKLEQLLSSLYTGAESTLSKTAHIGVANVYSRLKMYFGDDFSFNIESEIDCGTIVTLDIPLEAVK